MKLKLLAAALLFVPTMASAQSMNAQQFYQRAVTLQNKGALAIFSTDEIKALMDEAQAAGKRAREIRLAAVNSGRSPRFCPPDQPLSMNDKEFMARLSAIPAADRARINMTEAMTRILAAKFPCRA